MGERVACRPPVLPLSPPLPPPLPSPRPLNKYLLSLCCVSRGVWGLERGLGGWTQTWPSSHGSWGERPPPSAQPRLPAPSPPGHLTGPVQGSALPSDPHSQA